MSVTSTGITNHRIYALRGIFATHFFQFDQEHKKRAPWAPDCVILSYFSSGQGPAAFAKGFCVRARRGDEGILPVFLEAATRLWRKRPGEGKKITLDCGLVRSFSAAKGYFSEFLLSNIIWLPLFRMYLAPRANLSKPVEISDSC